MKPIACLLTVLLASAPTLLHAADSKRTAEYLLTTPSEFEGKEVTLDVSFVKPVHWKSPVPELAFFHALTMDRRDDKPGGEILVVVPSADAAKFAKKYGTDFKGRNSMTTLRGVLISTTGGRRHMGIWLVDTTGKVADLVEQNKLAIENGERGGGPGAGPGAGPGDRGWHRPGAGN